ncbi:uridine kinase [bacterium]|nr:uridine kinase [bacterium]
MEGPFTLGIAGGTGAGKTTLARAILDRFGEQAALIAYDAYYRDLSHLEPDQRAAQNFDDPAALETSLFVSDLEKLQSGSPVRVPRYDFTTHARLEEGVDIGPADVIVVEGILLLASESVCDRLDLAVYVEADADERILRRIRRDVEERGRSVTSVTEQYHTTVKPMHNLHVEPSRSRADLLVNGTGETERAVDLIEAHIGAHLAR